MTGAPGRHVRAAMDVPVNDHDGDGLVTAGKFTTATDKLFTLLDRCGDGLLTVEDLVRN